MTFDQANSEILKSFGTIDYKILHPKDGKLILGSNQTPTGDELVEIMTKRKSPLYICEYESSIDSSDELPPSGVIPALNIAKVVSINYISCGVSFLYVRLQPLLLK